MDPRDYLRVAATLVHVDDPAHRRSAVQRAYYAAYGVAALALSGKFGCEIPSSGESHGRVRQILQDCGDPALELAGDLLKDPYDWRVTADYEHHDPAPESPANARDAIELAERIIRVVDQATEEPRRARLSPRFKQWRRKKK